MKTPPLGKSADIHDDLNMPWRYIEDGYAFRIQGMWEELCVGIGYVDKEECAQHIVELHNASLSNDLVHRHGSS